MGDVKLPIPVTQQLNRHAGVIGGNRIFEQGQLPKVPAERIDFPTIQIRFKDDAFGARHDRGRLLAFTRRRRIQCRRIERGQVLLSRLGGRGHRGRRRNIGRLDGRILDPGLPDEKHDGREHGIEGKTDIFHGKRPNGARELSRPAL